MARIHIDVEHEVVETYRDDWLNANFLVLELGDSSFDVYKALGQVNSGATLTDFVVNSDGTLSLVFKRVPGIAG